MLDRRGVPAGQPLIIVGCTLTELQQVAQAAGRPVLGATTDAWTTTDGRVLAARSWFDDNGQPFIDHQQPGNWVLVGPDGQLSEPLGVDLLAILRGGLLPAQLLGGAPAPVVGEHAPGTRPPARDVRWSGTGAAGLGSGGAGSEPGAANAVVSTAAPLGPPGSTSGPQAHPTQGTAAPPTSQGTRGSRNIMWAAPQPRSPVAGDGGSRAPGSSGTTQATRARGPAESRVIAQRVIAVLAGLGWTGVLPEESQVIGLYNALTARRTHAEQNAEQIADYIARLIIRDRIARNGSATTDEGQ